MTEVEPIEDVHTDDITNHVADEFFHEKMIATVGGIGLIGKLLFGLYPGIYAGISAFIAWRLSSHFLGRLHRGDVDLQQFWDNRVKEAEDAEIREKEIWEERKAQQKKRRQRHDAIWRVCMIIVVSGWVIAGAVVLYIELTK